MSPEDVVELSVSGIVIVIFGFVAAAMLAPTVANILDSLIVQIISALVYVMVAGVFLAMFYQIIKSV